MSAPTSTSHTPAPAAWWQHPATAVLQLVRSDAAGLSHAEAEARLAQDGPNRLTQAPPPPAWRRLLRQFHNLLLYVLMAAAVVTASLGHWVDAGVISAVIVLNAVIGFVQEGKAERALQAIAHMLQPQATVWRDGQLLRLDAAALVRGDVVELAAGDVVAADVRLLQAHRLRVDESALTGESAPVDKQTDTCPADAPLSERLCMAYAGTLLTQGQALGVVVATGGQTEVGRIGRLLASVEAQTTPLLKQMDVLGGQLTSVILAVAVLLFGVGVWVHGQPAPQMFLAAVGLAVAAIPEGLPAILTITMALGVQRMARRHAIVRRLPVVEALGSVTTICSDKTGTLTRNEMTAQALVLHDTVLHIEGQGYAPVGRLHTAEGLPVAPDSTPLLSALAQALVLCNDAQLDAPTQADGLWQLTGDPTEGALLSLGQKMGLDPVLLRHSHPRWGVLPFDAVYRYMATLHPRHAVRDDAPVDADASVPTVMWVKGAPEAVLGLCRHALNAQGERVALDHAYWAQAMHAQALAGRRVLAVAQGDGPATAPAHLPALDDWQPRQGLTLLGLVSIIDPPRTEAQTAVAQCQHAGIRVVMITGDHAVTATAIATELGIVSPAAQAAGRATTLTGAEVEKMDDAALREAVAHMAVCARASPEHKIRLVQALQARGEVVAMTGDGVNDAPALKQADVGIAMGQKGTEVAKQAASMVLADDNFASIAHAVEEGRTVYDNLKKTIAFLLPINGGESISLLVAVLWGVTLPIAPVQILWVNMVSSIALALVLAFEPTEADVMRRPPRNPQEAMLSRFVVWRIALVSLLFAAGIFGVYAWVESATGSEALGRTAAVNALVAMEVFYLFSVRYLKAPAFTWQGVQGTPRVLMAVAAVAVLQLLFTYHPWWQHAFGTQALPWPWLLLTVAVGVSVLGVLEVEKLFNHR